VEIQRFVCAEEEAFLSTPLPPRCCAAWSPFPATRTNGWEAGACRSFPR